MSYFFFFNDTATTEIYTLSLHDALPISFGLGRSAGGSGAGGNGAPPDLPPPEPPATISGNAATVVQTALEALGDRKSTRLNSSHGYISYAVFCLKKKTRIRNY